MQPLLKDSLSQGILFFLALITICSCAQAAELVSVAKDGINIRTGPGTNNPVHIEVFEGYPLKVTQKEGNWMKVTDFENDSGWIETSLTRTNDTVIVNTKASANLRAEPNPGSAIVTSIERGVVLKKIGIRDQWLQVRHNSGVTGWIHQTLVWP
jgi:SH3-like domain-containing protein